MQRILRLFLALAVLTAAAAYTSGATFACDERNHPIIRLKEAAAADPKPEVVAPKPAVNESVVYNCSSSPLRERPPSFGPLMMAIGGGIASTGIIILLRRRRASMLIMGASLVGLFAAIGYFWLGL